jgi:hypothetical protein
LVNPESPAAPVGGDGVGATAPSTRLAIAGVRAGVPAAPGTASARSSPAPVAGPSGFAHVLDTGAAALPNSTALLRAALASRVPAAVASACPASCWPRRQTPLPPASRSPRRPRAPTRSPTVPRRPRQRWPGHPFPLIAHRRRRRPDRATWMSCAS